MQELKKFYITELGLVLLLTTLGGLYRTFFLTCFVAKPPYSQRNVFMLYSSTFAVSLLRIHLRHALC